MTTTARPLIRILSLGGTIASQGADAGGRGGVLPSLTADDLVGAVPQLEQVARIEASSVRQLGSSELGLLDLAELASSIEAAWADDAAGVVVTQGTDTLEETSFLLDLVVTSDRPVVLTGAMRHPTLPGADGPANLLAAVQVAASPVSRGLGALVVLNDEIHAARYVRKTHTTSPATFASPAAGPLGWLTEGEVRIAVHPPSRPPPLPRPTTAPPVALVTVGLGDDGRLVAALGELGYLGLVVEGMGGGHVPSPLVAPLADLAATMPVVLASRTGAGDVLRRTYGFPGSELDLLGRGLIPAGFLDGLKARILLSVLLAAGASRDAVARDFAERTGRG